LEVANPFYACEQSDLLKPSIDALRGSPGRENSVFNLSPDESSPVLASSEITSSKNLLLTFSKPILQAFDQSSFMISPVLRIDTVISLSSKQIELLFSEDFSANTIYNLSITGLKDCSENVYVQAEPLQIILPVQAKIGDVLINELLFNPKTGSPKFVELINVTDNYLEIKDWKLGNLDDAGEIDQIKQLSGISVIIPPKGFVAITPNPDQLKLDFSKSVFGQFVQLTTF